MPNNDDALPSLHEKLVAGLLRLQASFVLAPDFTWGEAVQEIEFEAVKIHEMFEAEFGQSREFADLVNGLLEGTEFASLGQVAGVQALYQDWADANRELSVVAAARDSGRELLKRVRDSVKELNLPGDTSVDQVAELVRRYRELYIKVIGTDVQSSGVTRGLAETRDQITQLEQERDEWKRAAEAEAQGRQIEREQAEADQALLDHLLQNVDPAGTYRDSLEERLANPLRQRLGVPRRFEHIPAPDCKKVKSQSGASYLHEGSKWLCTFAPFGNGEDREQTGAAWSQSEFRLFGPFVEMLDDKPRADR